MYPALLTSICTSTPRRLSHAAPSAPTTRLSPAASPQETEFAADLASHIRHRIRYLHALPRHLHPSLSNRVDDVDDSEGAASDRSEDRYCSHRPEDELEIEVVGDMGAVVDFTYSHGENGIRDEPDNDHVGTYGAVVVFLLLGFADAGLFHFESVTQIAQSFVIARINIELLAGHFQLDCIAFSADCGTEIDVDDIVAFSTPSHVVGIAEGIHLQSANIGR